MKAIELILGLWIAVPIFAFQPLSSLPSRRRTRSKKLSLSVLPKLIVFDLDNTMWTPELYKLRTLQRANQTPRAGKDVKLMEGTQKVLKEHVPKLQEQGVQFAVASRTKSVEWAHS
jgi:hypothetical protein